MDLHLFIVTVVILLVVYILSKLIPWLYQVWRSTRVLRKFSAVKPHWFTGHLGVHPGPTEAGFKTNIEWLKKRPRFYTFFFGPFRPVLCLNHPETVKQLLKTAEPKCFVGGGGYKLLLPWIGDGLLLSKGQKWFRNRRLLTPGFHFDVLKPYVAIYNDCTKHLANTFIMESENGKKSVEIFNPISHCTLSIILKCAFSYSEKIQRERGDKESVDNPYVHTVIELSRIIVERAFNPLLYIDSLYYATNNGKAFAKHCSFSHAKADDVIHKRRLALDRGEDPTKANRYIDFLDILLLAKDEDGKGLTDVEIRDEVETFMFAGHDTTASGISWALYNLARHPEFQEKARQEVNSILTGKDVKEIQWDDLSKLEYLTMCIKESLRLHPPVHFTSRELTKPLVIDGNTIPAGTVVDSVIYNVHHNPTVWGEDHMSYRPERFSPDNITKMDSFAFIPFSAGPRNCIGQSFAMNEMKCTIAYIIQKFEMAVDDNHPIELLPNVILKSKNGIKLYFKEITPTI